MPAFPDFDEPLGDDRIELRLSSERDIPETLIAHQDDPELYARLGLPRPPSGAELGRLAEAADADLGAGERVTLTILTPGSDDCRGQVSVLHPDWDSDRAELGIWVAPQTRGRGYARSALTLTARWLFERCGLERVALLTETDNEPMLAAAAAAGFVREGVLRGHTRERGRRIDLVSMSLLAADVGAIN